MRERRETEDAVVRGDAEFDRAHPRVAEEVIVRDGDRLGRGRRAGGIEQKKVVIRADIRRLEGLAEIERHQLRKRFSTRCVAADGDNELARRQFPAQIWRFLRRASDPWSAPSRCRPWRRCGRSRCSSSRDPVRRVDRLHHRAELVDREPADDEFGNVGQCHGDDVAVADAELLQRRGERSRAFAELRVGEARVVREQSGDVVGRGRDPARQPVPQRFVAPPILSAKIGRVETCRRCRHGRCAPLIESQWLDYRVKPSVKLHTRPDSTRDVWSYMPVSSDSASLADFSCASMFGMLALGAISNSRRDPTRTSR